MKIQEIMRTLFIRKIIIVSFAVILLLLICALFAPLLSPYDPYKIDLTQRLQGISAKHLLGTDQFGRDTLSRIMFGTRSSLLIAVVAILIAGSIGCTLGIFAGYFGGIIDTILSRFTDAMLSIPPILLAMAVGTAIGGGLKSIMIGLGITLIPAYLRMMRGQVIAVRKSDYITAQKVVGSSEARIILKHLIPNTISPLLVMITMNLGMAIMVESTLSFLGLGVEPPTAAWGSMVSDGASYLFTNPVQAIAPGAAIMVVVLSFNLFGDGIRDALDPHVKNLA